MTPKAFEEIKNKIESAKEKKARAEGAKEKIEQTWKTEYDIDSLEDAESKIAELEKEIEGGKNKLEKMYNELEASADWDSI